ncbi:DUF6415 family natural product biosynthesis protein [Streptomyces griseoincarnatus]
MTGRGEEIRAAYRRALYDMPPARWEEQAALVAVLEGAVMLLAPAVAAAAPRLSGETRETALTVLRHADELLDEEAPRADLQARLHDLGVVARSSLTLLEQFGAPGVPETPEGVRP